jgi:hypothetical protein
MKIGQLAAHTVRGHRGQIVAAQRMGIYSFRSYLLQKNGAAVPSPVSSVDMCADVCVYHMSTMIQIRNVPDALHRRLKARAALAGMSLSDYLLSEIREVAERPLWKSCERA